MTQSGNMPGAKSFHSCDDAEATTCSLPEHRVHFLYPFLLATQIERPQNNLYIFGNHLGKCFASDISNALKNEGLLTDGCDIDENAWNQFEHTPDESESGKGEDNKYLLPSADFFPHIASLAAGRPYQEKRLVQHWSLNRTVLQRLSENLTDVRFNRAAARRLGDSEDGLVSLKCQFLEIYLTAFTSGIGLLHVVLRYAINNKTLGEIKNLSENYIVEANYALCHRKDTYHSPVSKLAHVILSSIERDRFELKRRRTFAFTAIGFKNRTNNAERLATNLALKANEDYISRGSYSTEVCTLWRPTEQVIHAVSAEGGAIVVSDCLNNEFLQNFIRRNSNSYLALARLVLHENQAITQYGSRLSTLSNLKALRSGEYEMLADIRRCIYQYRLNYRFNKISEEARHNHVYDLWRKTFRLEATAAEVDSDVEQVTKFAEANRFATWRLLFRLGGAVVAPFTTIFALDASLELGLLQHLKSAIKQAIDNAGLAVWLYAHPWLASGIVLMIFGVAGYWAVSPGQRPKDHFDH